MQSRRHVVRRRFWLDRLSRALEARSVLNEIHTYPKGKSFVVASDVERPYTRTYAGVDATFVALEDLISRLTTERFAG